MLADNKKYEEEEKEMKYELEGNFELAKLFRNNPELGYLPIAARERGMYGAFVRGTSQLFFVFGYDEKMVMEGEFIEIDGVLYSANEYFKEHRAVIHSQYVLRRGFNARPLATFQHTASVTECIMEFMNDLERIKAISERFGIPFPEYFHYSMTFDATVRRYYGLIAGARTRREKACLEGELLRHFRANVMTSENPRPEDKGLTIEDYCTSPYCVDTDPRTVEKAFRHPERWDDRLFGYTRDYADNAALSSVFVNAFIAKNLERLVNLHHIPHRYANQGDAAPKLVRHLEATDLGSGKDVVGFRTILVYPAMYSMFMQTLIRWAYIDSFFTDEEQAQAYKLYQGGQFYGFSIPMIYQAVSFLKKRGIKVCAHKLLQFKVLSGGGDGYCIVPLRQKPLVDAALLDFAAMNAHAHDQGSVEFYSASELRIPKWEGGHLVSVCEYGFEAGSDMPDGGFTDQDIYGLHGDVPDEVLKGQGLLKDAPFLSSTGRNRVHEDKPEGAENLNFYSWPEV